MSSGLPHPDPFPVDGRPVRRLVHGRFPRWAGLPVERFPSGGTVNAMYRLGDDMVVRLPLVRGGVQDMRAEREWLPRLSPLLPTAVPEVLGAGEPAEGCPWPWSVYRWLPGELPEAGAPTDPGALAADLAGFVTAMRRITLPNAPKAYRGGRLNAVIDFGCLGVGDPACDLLPAWNLLPADAREVLRQRLGVDDATWRRGRGRALSQAVTALPYYRDTNAAMAGNARHVVQEVLAEKRRAGRYS